MAPQLEHCGIKTIVNGPISYTPDGSPLIGPAWGVKNVWLNEGHSFGVTAAGGAGWQLAQWIVEGEPTVEMLAVDPRRYGPYSSKNGKLAGRATTGYYGHVLGKSLALGSIDTAYSEVGTELEIEILGQRKKATVLIESPLDPENTRLRA